MGEYLKRRTVVMDEICHYSTDNQRDVVLVKATEAVLGTAIHVGGNLQKQKEFQIFWRLARYSEQKDLFMKNVCLKPKN